MSRPKTGKKPKKTNRRRALREDAALQSLIDIEGETCDVHHPPHYGGKDNPREVIKVIEEYGLGFRLGNAVKYLLRAGRKAKTDRLTDLEKAAWYLEREIDRAREGRHEA